MKIIKFKTITLLVLLVVFVASIFLLKIQSSAEDIKTSPGIDEFVTSKMEDLRIPGVAIGVVQGEQIKYIKSYGKADLGGRPAAPQTPFILGSTTKSFTALAIIQLAEKGKLELDAPVQQYIPWFSLSDPEASKTITIRNLLNQTSGIPGTAGGSDYLNSSSTSEDFVKRLNTQDIEGQPGKQYQYSEANYVILGVIVSKVSGQTYEEYIKNNIFEPLNMKHSFTSKDEAIKDGLATGYRTCFGFPFPGDFPYPKQYAPASYLISSAEDMAHYLIAYINNGTYNNTSILSPSGIQQLLSPGVSLEHPVGYSYAMGWYVNDEYQSHDGRPTNYYSCMVITPKNKTGVIVLTNANNRLVTAEYSMAIAYGISDILAGKKVEIADTGFRQIYFVFDLIVLSVVIILLVRLIFSIKFLRRTLAGNTVLTTRKMFFNILPEIIFIAALTGILLYLLDSFGISLPIATLGQPDIIIAFITALAIATASLIIRVVRMMPVTKVIRLFQNK